MIALDEAALVCDLAETYGIFNYRALPLSLVATLCFGLGLNSRIKSKLIGLKVPLDTFLITQVVDHLAGIRWMISEDGHEGKNRPPSISAIFLEKNDEDETETFDSPDDFETFRACFFAQQAPERGD